MIPPIEFAQNYASSTFDADSEAAKVYTHLVRAGMNVAENDLDQFFDHEVAQFRTAVDDAGIGLFKFVITSATED